MLSNTTFSNLRLNQFGAGWAATGRRYGDIGCTGIPILRMLGNVQGEDVWHVDPEEEYDSDNEELADHKNIVFSASWVDLRTRFPPDSVGTRYLAWQGVKRLVWGTNTISLESDGVPFPRARRKRRVGSRERGQRLNGWADEMEKGTAVIQTPKRWRYPSVYNVNGTDFRENGDGVFRSSDGRVLGLRTMRAG
ncbi:MAG: hypothetical protein Q9166_000630 [cf. Caloplaca sp. 2 TL-2023]